MSKLSPAWTCAAAGAAGAAAAGAAAGLVTTEGSWVLLPSRFLPSSILIDSSTSPCRVNKSTDHFNIVKYNATQFNCNKYLIFN